MKKFKQRTGFAKIPHALIDTWGQILGPYVYMVYTCIISHASYKTQSGFPSYATIATKCGMTERMAINCIADLVFIGFLAKKSCWHPDGSQVSNVYYLLEMPSIDGVMEMLLGDSVHIPKKHQWIVDKLREYATEKSKNCDYDSLLKARKAGLNDEVGGEHGSPPRVNMVHSPGEHSSPPRVNMVHSPGEHGSPKRDTCKKTHIKNTHLHTAENEKESQATSLDSTEKGVASDSPIEERSGDVGETLIWGNLLMGDEEKTFIKYELLKLSDKNVAQHVLDEVLTKYTAGKVKTSLTAYTKGLVNKANNKEFTPTNNLQLKRAEKAQKATIAKSNTPVAERTFTRSSELIANLKQTIAAGGGRALKKTPEEQAEIDKALVEIATRKK